MKTRPIEIITISLMLLATATVSLCLTLLFTSLSRSALKDYHVLADLPFFLSSFIILSALTVRTMLSIAPLHEETFSMLSKRAFYWKVLTSASEVGGMFFLPFVPLFLRPLFFSLFGAKIGKNVEIAGKLIEPSLITLEDYAFVGGGTFITAHAITHDSISLKPVRISRKATIGLGAIILPGVEVGENSIIAPGAVVLRDTKIPANEFWGGVPAKKIKDITPAQ